MTALYLCWNQRNRRFVGDEILIVFEGKDGWLDFSKNAYNLFPLKHSRDAGGEHRPERPESVVI